MLADFQENDPKRSRIGWRRRASAAVGWSQRWDAVKYSLVLSPRGKLLQSDPPLPKHREPLLLRAWLAARSEPAAGSSAASLFGFASNSPTINFTEWPFKCLGCIFPGSSSYQVKYIPAPTGSPWLPPLVISLFLCPSLLLPCQRAQLPGSPHAFPFLYDTGVSSLACEL